MSEFENLSDTKNIAFVAGTVKELKECQKANYDRTHSRVDSVEARVGGIERHMEAQKERDIGFKATLERIEANQEKGFKKIEESTKELSDKHDVRITSVEKDVNKAKGVTLAFSVVSGAVGAVIAKFMKI